MSRLRLHLWVEGHVQGVMFRESTRRQAERQGVAGWVRNLPDGRVEAVLEGEEAAVQAVEEWCRHGPANAGVSALRAVREEPQGESGFQVLR